MIADVLDTLEARQTVYPVSVEFYHEAGKLGMIGDDVELLEGVIFKKMPKSPLHQYLVRKLQSILAALVPSGYFVDRESPITCAASEPEPDVAVFVGSSDDYQSAHPTTAELVIEIAISTVQRDRSKAAIYAGAGVKEYWLIEPEASLVTLHTNPKDNGYATTQTFSAQDLVPSTLFPAFALRLADLTA
jgi:Uma2 family endonuclease